MERGLEVQSEGDVLCRLPGDFRCRPLASESTEADDNFPDACGNSGYPALFSPGDASMDVPLPHSFSSFADIKPATKSVLGRERRTQEWRLGEEGRFDCNNQSRNSANSTIRSPERHSGRPVDHGPEHRALYLQCNAAETAKVPFGPPPEAVVASVYATEDESDDGVAVYIDEAEDDDSCEALVITEHRINAKKATEDEALKSKWVRRMLRERDRILGISPDKLVEEGRGSSNAVRTERIGDTACRAGYDLEMFRQKLEAFAKCMTPEALECIQGNIKRWTGAVSDPDDSPSASGSPHSARRKQCREASRSVPPRGGNLPSTTSTHAAVADSTSPRHPKGNRGKFGVNVSATAFEEWGRFLHYVRKTCTAVRPRPRIELSAGLESDDDDEQAPLYMCRPGSAQRPSPLICHSLTEHLKAAHTLFFKHFTRENLSVPPRFQGVSLAPPQQGRLAHVASSAVVAECTGEQPADAYGSASPSASDDKGRAAESGPSSATDTQDGIPLYEMTAEASVVFGDLMRLEDTMRMLEASCTFRLAAAPHSTIHRQKLLPKDFLPARNGTASTRTLRVKGANLLGADALASNPKLAHHKWSAHVEASTVPIPAEFTPLNQRTSILSANSRLKRGSTQPVLESQCYGREKRQEQGLSAAVGAWGPASRIVYTVQADEETLAMSGLDSDYCARVSFASQGAQQAVNYPSQLNEAGPNESLQQEPLPALAVIQRKSRTLVVRDTDPPSADNDSDSECMVLDEAGSGRSRGEAAEEADQDRSLMADRILLAHFMPYLPQFGAQ